MKLLDRTLLLASAGAALAPAIAHAQIPNTVPMRTSVLQHPVNPPGYVAGQATEVALGQFSDDAVPDAAVLMNGTVHFLYAPDRRNSWAAVGGGYTSIATRPAGQSESIDDVLASSSTGLRRLQWDGSPTVRTLVDSAVPGTSNFAFATNLQVQRAGSGPYEVVALHVTRKFIARATWDPTAGTLTPLANLGTALDSTAVVALQWDADTALEYASCSPTGLRVTDHDGTILVNVAEAGMASNLAVVPVHGQPDRVAWARTPNGSAWNVTVVRQGGAQDSSSWFFGAPVTSMRLMELDGGLDPELVLFSSYLPGALALQRGTTETFLPFPTYPALYIDLDRANSAVAPNSSECAPGTGVYGSNMTPPATAVADLDGDGDDDLFAAGHAGSGEAGRALVYFGAVTDEEYIILDTERTRAWLPSYTLTRVGDTMQLAFEYPTRPLVQDSPAGEATHLRISAWVQSETATALDRAAVADLVQDLDESPLPELAFDVPNLSSLGVHGSIHLEIAYLRYEAGTQVHAFPAFHERLLLSRFPLPSYGYVLVDNNRDLDGGGASGSTERPPISPPSGGGGGSTTP